MPRRGVVHKRFFEKSGTEIAKYPPIGRHKTIRKTRNDFSVIIFSRGYNAAARLVPEEKLFEKQIVLRKRAGERSAGGRLFCAQRREYL